MNQQRHSTTGVSPFRAMFGQEMNTAVGPTTVNPAIGVSASQHPPLTSPSFTDDVIDPALNMPPHPHHNDVTQHRPEPSTTLPLGSAPSYQLALVKQQPATISQPQPSIKIETQTIEPLSLGPGFRNSTSPFDLTHLDNSDSDFIYQSAGESTGVEELDIDLALENELSSEFEEEGEENNRNTLHITDLPNISAPEQERRLNKLNDLIQGNTARAQQKMVDRYSKSKNSSIEIFEKGDFVSVFVPRKSRGATDPKRVLGQVAQVVHGSRYQVRCVDGTIDRYHPTRELERIPIAVVQHMKLEALIQNCPKRRITLASACKLAAQRARTATMNVTSCVCKATCGTNRCPCFKAKTPCNNACHSFGAGISRCTNLLERPFEEVQPSESAEQTNADIQLSIGAEASSSLIDVSKKQKRGHALISAGNEKDRANESIEDSSQPITAQSGSNNSDLSKLEGLRRRLGLPFIEALRYAIDIGLPSIPMVLHLSEEVFLEDRARQLENFIARTIRQYEKLDFYFDYQNRRSTKGSSTGATDDETATFASSSSPQASTTGFRTQMNKVPYGYYSIARFELIALITENHMPLLKKRLRETKDWDHRTSSKPPMGFIGAVIVPEVLTHMIALDLHIDYDDALDVLKSKEAMLYGDLVEKEYLHHHLKGLSIASTGSTPQGRRGIARH